MLADKVIIVTGAARGLGQAYCVAFAELGARVVAADIASCDETVRLATSSVIPCKLDVTDMASATGMAKLAVENFGRIDGIVNNAALYGTLRGGKFDAIAETDWDAAMAVNVKGIWNCCKAVGPTMRAAKGGSIVNIASLAATYGMPYALHYTTSKAAVIGLTRGLARELGRDRIRVNSIAPSACPRPARMPASNVAGRQCRTSKMRSVPVRKECSRATMGRVTSRLAAT